LKFWIETTKKKIYTNYHTRNFQISNVEIEKMKRNLYEFLNSKIPNFRSWNCKYKKKLNDLQRP